MAKALMGHLPTGMRGLDHPDHLVADNAKLRARVAELNALVGALQNENDALMTRMSEIVAASMVQHDTITELQPV